MKLLIATTVIEYREQLQEIFSEYKVPYYNEIEMKGVKRMVDQHRLGNWFGTGTAGLENIAFVSLMSEEQSSSLFKVLTEYEDSAKNKVFSVYILEVNKAIEVK
ncbi:hypothetical protein [Saccharicrinis aurantiacus]|uniref:hypothetical protein n=1 Tax=Saccharicrinis aurantiacus TaxID=1849719 RepID=UPI00094FCAE8|nr:hypothetical protein [Saccharicrinis aurantiacus]